MGDGLSGSFGHFEWERAISRFFFDMMTIYHIVPSGEWKGQKEADQENKNSSGSSPHWFPLKTFQHTSHNAVCLCIKFLAKHSGMLYYY